MVELLYDKKDKTYLYYFDKNLKWSAAGIDNF